MTEVHNFAVIKHLLNVYRVSGIEDAEMNCWSQVAHRMVNKCINEQVNKHLGICTGAEPEINTGLEEAQAEIKIAGRNINTSDMQMTPPLWQKVKRS